MHVYAYILFSAEMLTLVIRDFVFTINVSDSLCGEN